MIKIFGPGRIALVSVLSTGYWYRPNLYIENNSGTTNNRQYPIESNDNPLPILVSISRQLVLFFGVTFSRAFLTLTGEFSILHDRNYHNFIRRVSFREDQRPLITVSNHRSLVDEPTLLSSLLPYNMNIQPKYIRYSICAQEYCFNDKLGDVLHGIVGLGKVMPIKRGAGISQQLFKVPARVVATGNWLHIFPEGGIWQLSGLGGRRDDLEKGKLKWGVGRLIAHSPRKPVVIAFYFNGMETIMPHDHETKKLLVRWPQTGHKVKMIFSEEIDFQDLLDAHEKRNGPLWKFCDLSSDSDTNRWDNPSAAELSLYCDITKKIESTLDSLGQRIE